MKDNKLENKLSMKLISVGDVEVGKSCRIKRYCNWSFVEDYITTLILIFFIYQMMMNISQ